MEIHDRDEVLAVLSDPAFTVPHVPEVDAPVGIAWLRSHVSRFCSGAEHARRRGRVVAELEQLDPVRLRRAARERTTAELRAGGSPETVPVEVLAAALGLPDGLATDVALAAAAYQPHAQADLSAADGAVARLVEACGGRADDATAVRISLLVQASPGTSALVRGAQQRDDLNGSVDELLVAMLCSDPPVPTTRRVTEEGTVVTLDLTAGGDGELQFGAGLRPCPGREHALALAAGVLEALRA
jgi:hypothetical protein